MHDPDFRQSWKDWESLVDVLSEKISEIDETVPELPPKDLVLLSWGFGVGVLTLRTGFSDLPRRSIQSGSDSV